MTKYWTKLPRVKFQDRVDQKPKWWKSEAAARSAIEHIYAAGYTGEPYIQLVIETDDSYRVIAEWQPSESRWLDPLTAALCG